jgi:hypothetical protein
MIFSSSSSSSSLYFKQTNQYNMFYSNTNSQESPMNLLISPFEPTLQYPGNNNDSIHNNTTQPLDVPNNDNNTDLMMYDSSPIVLSNNDMLKPTFHNSLPSPHIEMMGNFVNDFVSRSPESSTSTESNMVSPSQHYHPTNDFIWQDAMVQQQQQHHNYPHHHYHSASKRSASVPPQFHKFKPHVQDSMYNQFQVTPSSFLHQQHHLKALPIQIQRVNAQTQPTKPVDTEALRRQLDEKLEKVNFDDITVAELKEMLRERGLSATGRKAELMNRLKEEYELLIQKGGAAGAAGAATSSPTLSSSSLQRRVASMNLGSPKKQSTRLFSPYSPPQSSNAGARHHNSRYASSVPDSHTSFLNDQFMMKRKPSSLRKSIDQDQEQEHRGNEIQLVKSLLILIYYYYYRMDPLAKCFTYY